MKTTLNYAGTVLRLATIVILLHCSGDVLSQRGFLPGQPGQAYTTQQGQSTFNGYLLDKPINEAFRVDVHFKPSLLKTDEDGRYPLFQIQKRPATGTNTPRPIIKVSIGDDQRVWISRNMLDPVNLTTVNFDYNSWDTIAPKHNSEIEYTVSIRFDSKGMKIFVYKGTHIFTGASSDYSYFGLAFSTGDMLKADPGSPDPIFIALANQSTAGFLDASFWDKFNKPADTDWWPGKNGIDPVTANLLRGSGTGLPDPSNMRKIARIQGPSTMYLGAGETYTDAVGPGTWQNQQKKILTDTLTGQVTAQATGIDSMVYVMSYGNVVQKDTLRVEIKDNTFFSSSSYFTDSYGAKRVALFGTTASPYICLIGPDNGVYYVYNDNLIALTNGPRDKINAKEIIVDQGRTPWVITAGSRVMRYNWNDKQWIDMQAPFTPIKIATGRGLVIASDSHNNIYRYLGSKWVQYPPTPGAERMYAVEIAVDKDGAAWLIDDQKQLNFYNAHHNTWLPSSLGKMAYKLFNGADGSLFTTSTNTSTTNVYKLGDNYDWAVYDKFGFINNDQIAVYTKDIAFKITDGIVNSIPAINKSVKFMKLAGAPAIGTREICFGGTEGVFFVIGSNRKVYGWRGGADWDLCEDPTVSIQATSIGVDRFGLPWIVNIDKEIYKWKVPERKWIKIGGTGIKVICGYNDGDIFRLNLEGGLSKWGGTGWIPYPADGSPAIVAREIAVDVFGRLWYINAGGTVFYRDPLTQTWINTQQSATKIGCGLDGSVFITDASHIIKKWDGFQHFTGNETLTRADAIAPLCATGIMKILRGNIYGNDCQLTAGNSLYSRYKKTTIKKPKSSIKKKG